MNLIRRLARKIHAYRTITPEDARLAAAVREVHRLQAACDAARIELARAAR